MSTNLFTGIANIAQSHINYERENVLEKEYFEKEIEAIRQQFNEELTLNKQTHLLSSFYQLQGYFQELNENLISTARDSERDMYDSRNQHFQNIMLASTIMLTSLLAILYQGELPENAEKYSVIGKSFKK